MDIKDLIIVAGSVFFIVIVAHGLWVARRDRFNDIRMDIQASGADTNQSKEEFSSELPNGGARVIGEALQREDTQPVSSIDEPIQQQGGALLVQPQDRIQPQPVTKTKSEIAPAMDDLFDSTEAEESAVKTSSWDQGDQIKDDRDNSEQISRRQEPQLEELIILGVMAKKDAPFGGEALVAALRGQGLKYGEMGIFHRLDAGGDDRLFSVANAVEPGTFDLSDLEALQTPGLTFFLQLPVPGDALETLDDMILSARTVAAAMGGDVKDDSMSALTGQTVEHMKQRIADYARKQLTVSSDD